MMIDTTVSKYLYYGYRREAYQSIRLDELITEMCFGWLCDISCANCPPQSIPKPTIKHSFVSKYCRKLRKQDILKIKILPESWDTNRYRKNIIRNNPLQSETKIEALSEIQVFAHGDNCRKRDFQSVVARNSRFWFRKFQQNLRERRTLVRMSYYSIL